MILCGNAKLIDKIARDGAEALQIEMRRSLAPVLKRLVGEGYRIVGLEQTTNSQNLHEYGFQRKSVLVVGNERLGIPQDILDLLDDVIEIPVWGMPHSYNAATATNMVCPPDTSNARNGKAGGSGSSIGASRWPSMWCTAMAGQSRASAIALPAAAPTSKAPIRPGPAV